MKNNVWAKGRDLAADAELELLDLIRGDEECAVTINKGASGMIGICVDWRVSRGYHELGSGRTFAEAWHDRTKGGKQP